MNEKMIEIQGVTKSFGELQVLKGIDLTIYKGEVVSIVGPSGAGKTTLLQIMGTLDKADSGSVFIHGMEVGRLKEKELSAFRNHQIGFVFQSFHLLPELSILENTMLPGLFTKTPKKALLERAEILLEKVGLKDRIMHRPNELSGGEQQRAAIARSLMNSPSLLLADEPTGNLDSVTGSGILELFQEFHRERKMSIIMVTHDRSIAGLADRTVELKDGLLLEQSPAETSAPEEI